MAGAVGHGTFTWKLPAVGVGARPAGLGPLQRGEYVVRADAVGFGSTSRSQTQLLGNATVLLRGAGGVLACATLISAPGGSSFTLSGGTGVARRAAATMTLTKPVDFDLPDKAVKQLPAESNSGRVTAATTATPKELPAVCAALKRYLP